jgi:Tfp pilus assembly protein FimT
VAPGSALGATLIEVVAALSLAALVSASTIPVVAGTLERERTIAGAHFVAARIGQAQMEALRRGVSVALRVDVQGDDAVLQMFADGNGNGISTAEITAGTDAPIGPAERVGVHASGVSLRINQRVIDAGGTRWLEAGTDPLRIGSTALVSCSPTGSLTSGTLYVAATRGPQMAVRLTGTSGRVRVLRFDPAAVTWLP